MRGGSLYAVGADIVDCFGTDILSSELFGFLIGIVVDSFTNMVKALKKPLEKKLFGQKRPLM